PKNLTADAQLPFQVLKQPVLDAIRPVYDTSRGTSVELFPGLPPPVGQVAWVGLQRFWFQPADTSQGLALDLRPIPFIGTPANASLIKTGQIPTLTIPSPFSGVPGV